MMTTTTEPTASTIKIGDGATIFGFSDSKAATVIAVSKSGRQIILQEDSAKLLNGVNSGEPDALKFTPGGFFGHTSGIQRWECTPNHEGVTRKFSLRDDGRWIEVGQSTKNGTRAIVGKRTPHYDFNF